MVYTAKNKFPLRKVIAVDFDGTLSSDGTLNKGVAKFLRLKKSEGFQIFLWSARGEELVKRAVQDWKLEDIFDHVLSKPGYILDDKGWTWIQYTKVIKSASDV